MAANSALKLYLHPLSAFCHKVLIALYESGTTFDPIIVNFDDPASRDAFLKVWPIGRFPVLRDEARDWLVPESSVIVEYLEQHYPGPAPLLPVDAEGSRQVRSRDRFLDHYVMEPMQKIVTDRLRPAGRNDPHGVESARATLRTALGMIEPEMANRTWAMGDAFTLVDCTAAPALFYADKVDPLAEPFPNLARYLDRLRARPSFARVLKEAEPYLKLFPEEPKPARAVGA